jgi:two-component system, cell cycle response regulator
VNLSPTRGARALADDVLAAPPVRRVFLLLATVLLVLVSVQILGGWAAEGGAAAWFFEAVLYNAVLLAAGLACILGGRRSRDERHAWLLIGLGPIAWALGDLYYTLAFVDIPAAEVPFPSLADVGYLAFYPPIFVGAGLLARTRLVRFAHSSWIDVVIAALTAGAVAAALVFEPVLASTGGDAAAVATNLAYPLADAVLLAGITGAIVLAGRRVTRDWLLLAIGLGCFALSDSVYLVRVAADAYAYGSVVDVGWIAGPVLLALAGTVRAETVRSSSPGSLPYVPAVFGLVGVALLTYDHFASINVLAVVLAAASLLAVVARMTLSLLENERLLRRTRVDAETDSLTRLRNRRKLKADLDTVCAEGRSHVLLMFDLDGFKGYNDTFGHPAGDALLLRLGQRLAAVPGAGAHAYRLGGDEFCLLVPGDRDDLERLREQAQAALSEDGEGFSIRSSCGGALLPLEAATPAEALRLVDVRLYEQKATRPSAGVQTLTALMAALRERDPHLVTHTGDVARTAAAVGRRLGLEPERLQQLALAAQLHDIGKLAIPDSILTKTAGLSELEWVFMRRHTAIGERIISVAPALANIGHIIRGSHERWDGTGYPDGLAGERIPVESRIIFACDSYDAMISERPYRRAISPAAARAELRRCSGTQFDPAVVDALLAVLATRSAVAGEQVAHGLPGR